ncbi:hypothetical protein CesoFtcFv8_012083 [Champsocephalus esox]|uniref:Uncharacterized protein n=1 Tax=Champsocephalus esox TaxID=159716 RepID=A0AAN8GV91_9TELE|nr:hypothetical protein CesoFtcFv8_012083 [Champsocephalus esox]
MATSLDIDNEEEYPVHPPPFSPHTECDEEDCRQVMLENVALRAQMDALIDEVKTLRSRLKKGLKPRQLCATAAVLEEEEECIRFKGLAISSTSGINTAASGSQTPLKTPVKTVMRSPAASGSQTPLRTPVKTVMRSPAASRSQTPLNTPVKTVMRPPAASCIEDWPSPHWSTGKGGENTMREITLPQSMETYIQTSL